MLYRNDKYQTSKRNLAKCNAGYYIMNETKYQKK